MIVCYAAKVNGKISAKTIYEHERGAQVNALKIHFNVMPLDNWSDEFITNTWEMAREEATKLGHQIEIVKVRVEELN